MFSLHPLIRDWLQLRLSSQQRRLYVQESIDMIVSSARNLSNQGLRAGVKQTLLLHMDTALEHDARYLKVGQHLGEEMTAIDKAGTFGEFYWHSGRLNSAYKLFDAIRRTSLVAEGPEGPVTLSSMRILGLLLSSLGDYEAAATMLLNTAKVGVRVMGVADLGTLSCMASLATVLDKSGKLEMAEQLFIAVLQNSLGTDLPDPTFLLTTMHNLAVVLGKQCKFAEAEHINRDLLSMRRRLLGEEQYEKHPETQVGMNNLGLALMQQGKSAEAETIFRQVMDIQNRSSGAEHPSQLTFATNLSSVLQKENKLEEAESILQSVVDKWQGKDVQMLIWLSALERLASILMSRDKNEAAEPVLEQIVSIKSSCPGMEPATMADSMRELAHIKSVLGKHETADDIRLRAQEAEAHTVHCRLQ